MSGNCSVGCLSNQTYGGNCSIPCNQNCKNCICDRNNGHCQLGCSTGWYGEMCDKQCNGNCFTSSCNQSDGTCVYGCKIGWYGEQCTQQCSDGCLDKICLVDTGNCSRGCAPGYKGPQCDKDLESQKMCYECDNMSSPQYCDSVANCQASETCFIESHKAAHGKKFRSGCMDEKKCRMLESANTTSVCVECCYNSMCNNRGCGNSDFPSREHRGPMCFGCLHTGDPKTCDTVSMCTPNQVCSIEKFQWGEGFHYKQGCANKVCNSLSYHKRSIPLCHSCCEDDYCNRNCTSNTSNNGEIFVG
ncbi:protein draper-like [Mercenaria mercenaria]|uniref:protein draper-like n=1 Tax=Mercenaria mercenaria TaxID=6596 RepID=UPI00234F2228|nr:protein draper-like [Mercenaria mercenaria]